MSRVACQGFFNKVGACGLKAEFVVLVGNEHRFACTFCKRGKKLIKKL